MGVDKKNIRTVVHMAPPASPEAYLQESGRASRDGLGAEAWLIYTPEDVSVTDDLRSAPRKAAGAGRPAQAALEGDSGGPAPADTATLSPPPL